ncbi:MAG: basic amino acid ABC transporter substrate-binding protein, partial [Maritimibacter sp.]
MKILALAAAFAATASAALAADLPDLGGREVAVMSENTYPPLQFI